MNFMLLGYVSVNTLSIYYKKLADYPYKKYVCITFGLAILVTLFKKLISSSANLNYRITCILVIFVCSIYFDHYKNE